MGRAEQIVLVLCIRFEAGPDVVGDVFFTQVFDVQLGCTGLDGLFFETVKLRALTDIAGDGDDFTVVVVFLEPRNDNGGIETAGVCKNDLFDVFFLYILPFVLKET